MAASMKLMDGMKLTNVCRFCLCTRNHELRQHLSAYLTLARWVHNTDIIKPINFPPGTDIDQRLRSRIQKISDLKTHPGIMRIKVPKLPERLLVAAFALSEKHPRQQLYLEGKHLNFMLTSRRVPTEDEKRLAKAMEIAGHLKGEVDWDNMDEEKRQKMEPKLKHKFKKQMKRATYSWKPIVYTPYTGIIYMVARLAPNYSVLMQCLSEISKRDPKFVPRSIYDSGSGIGTSVWASHELWGKQVFEYYCVDPSGEMNDIARLLLQDGKEQSIPHIQGVHFRQYQPSDIQNKFDLVISQYTLLEQASRYDRLEMVSALWNMTTAYLVLIEQGTHYGYQTMMEARDFILQTTEDCDTGAHVFSPCTHDAGCPKIHFPSHPCTFSVNYKKLVLSKLKAEQAAESQSEPFTYIILKKGHRKEQGVKWPRMVETSNKAHHHVHCYLCCPDGSLQHMIATKKKHKDFYRSCMYSQHGDLLPVDWNSDMGAPKQGFLDLMNDGAQETASSQVEISHSDGEMPQTDAQPASALHGMPLAGTIQNSVQEFTSPLTNEIRQNNANPEDTSPNEVIEDAQKLAS